MWNLRCFVINYLHFCICQNRRNVPRYERVSYLNHCLSVNDINELNAMVKTTLGTLTWGRLYQLNVRISCAKTRLLCRKINCVYLKFSI